MAINQSLKRWQDQLILVLGLWLIVSPWAFADAADRPEVANAVISGLVIAVLAAFDLYKTYFWAVVLNLALGIWVAVSPWVLQIADRGPMTWNSLIVGIAVAVLALWELRTDPELLKHWPGAGAAT
ncbi:SPW repeat protein [Janthinobacterium agaricidamnosum]|uniref:SPW repeat family protein n=1 Tax=Janthinobacterium agaricidamnosum NBRC 102515 = DSM 9628 TaxID=1349767 RepID=W0V8T2_9BURK|nr:SPW repeat protein [Janthinobacterium agaricidamnosum]CDG85239.1 SPW repeat family protein [Janthinobacterium agaricidamnosum NBRC 102515 = DSM 9628]